VQLAEHLTAKSHVLLPPKPLRDAIWKVHDLVGGRALLRSMSLLPSRGGCRVLDAPAGSRCAGGASHGIPVGYARRLSDVLLGPDRADARPC